MLSKVDVFSANQMTRQFFLQTGLRQQLAGLTGEHVRLGNLAIASIVGSIHLLSTGHKIDRRYNLF